MGTYNEYTKTKRQPRDDKEDEFELKLVRVWDYEEFDGHGVSTMGLLQKTLDECGKRHVQSSFSPPLPSHSESC